MAKMSTEYFKILFNIGMKLSAVSSRISAFGFRVSEFSYRTHIKLTSDSRRPKAISKLKIDKIVGIENPKVIHQYHYDRHQTVKLDITLCIDIKTPQFFP